MNSKNRNKMFSICFFFILALVASTPFEEADKIIKIINSGTYNWNASHNKFSFYTLEEKKRMIGSLPITPTFKADKVFSSKANIPDEYNAIEEYPHCTTIGAIQDQGGCGSCWAFAASEVLSDKLCIDGKHNTQLSAQDLTSCDYTNLGCSGGNMQKVFVWMSQNGVCSEECMKYVSGDGHVPSCPSKCDDESSIVRYKCESYGYVVGASEMKKKMYEVGILDIRLYRNTIPGPVLGGHAVKGVGYGNEGGDDYWLLANSWGDDWGEDGFFKMLRGKDECTCEQYSFYCSAV